MNRQEYRDSVRAGAKGSFVCLNCGKEAYRRISGTNKAKGHGNKYCSMACRAEHAARISAEIEQRVAAIKREIKAIKRLGKATYKPKKVRCVCGRCGDEFIAKRTDGRPRANCDSCLAEAKIESRRISKAKRRAVERGASADQIDPIAVFERDGWRCHICGTKLKRKDRGTTKASAPELDHIVSLAEGGTHTLSNVACACRKCNLEKSSRSFGQLVLVLID